jgi:peptide-methionine (S)-S-oxide reductase
VWVTAVVYAGGSTQHPSYEEVCSGLTGHTEAVLVGYDPALTTLEALLRLFFETHDPTQGMRQGNDIGTQPATTEIAPAGEFFYAEGYHQQYLAKNPNGYRCHSTTGVPFPA